jgi:hypothetical protein
MVILVNIIVFDHVQWAIITLVLIIIMVRIGIIIITIIRRVGCIVVGVKGFIDRIGGFVYYGEFNGAIGVGVGVDWVLLGDVLDWGGIALTRPKVAYPTILHYLSKSPYPQSFPHHPTLHIRTHHHPTPHHSLAANYSSGY